MSRVIKFQLISAFIAASCWGQIQVNASSPSSFTLRGATIGTGQGVPSWPVLTGDTVKAGKAPVTLTFSDGSTITLDPGAEATLDLSGKTPVFKLMKGTAEYALKTPASVELVSGGQNVTVAGLTGTLGKTAGTKAGVIIAGVGGGLAAGAAVGVSKTTGGVGGQTSGGPSVSPSH
jgi:hypothetical protein